MSVRGKDRQIDNIEFNVDDIARSKAFYGSAFGWTFVDYGPTYTEFSDGRLTGGFTTGEPVRPGGPLIILYSDDLDEAQQRLRSAQRDPLPGLALGRYSSGRCGSSHDPGRINLKCTALLARIAGRSGQRCRTFVVKRGNS
jgi:catechol 2,3-dioxygenase-like lactoylglutathione lyase family enzyme